MNRQSLLMGTMIDRLMLLDRWEHSTSDARPIDVSQLVEDVVTPISEAAAPRHVRLDVAPGALAAIDPSELGHAVTNLLDNALKYTGGSVDVRVRQSPAQVEIEVADEGPGMAPRELAHAFDRFYRGETRRNVEGSGLGLSIAKAAVERARGTLRVQSGPAGTRFTIALPPSRTASLERPVEVTTT
jgi:signal transduction histidine kinase